jgi:hypothetical protein
LTAIWDGDYWWTARRAGIYDENPAYWLYEPPAVEGTAQEFVDQLGAEDQRYRAALLALDNALAHIEQAEHAEYGEGEWFATVARRIINQALRPEGA